MRYPSPFDQNSSLVLLCCKMANYSADGEDPDTGRLHITRLSERKNWTKIYHDRVEGLAEERAAGYVAPERKNLQQAIASGCIIANKLGKHVRRRLKNKKYTCRRSIDNLKPPDVAARWNPIIGTQLVCDICGLSALNDCTACTTCNAVAHRLCVGHLFGRPDEGPLSAKPSFVAGGGGTGMSRSQDVFLEEEDEEEEDSEDDSFSGSGSDGDEEGKGPDDGGLSQFGSQLSMDTDNQAAATYSVAVGEDEFTCGSCRLNEEEDTDFYQHLHTKLQGERRYVLAVRVVARRILAFIERSRFKKLRKSLILLQSAIRKRRAKRWLFFLRQNMIRVCIVDPVDFPDEMRPSDMVCLTIVDPMQHGKQFFRYDKTMEMARVEGFFIPGATAMQTIVLTILRPEEHMSNTSYFMMGQAQLAVRDGDYNERRPYRLTFNKAVTWVPQDPQGAYTA